MISAIFARERSCSRAAKRAWESYLENQRKKTQN
jgi:hypothetical protein